MTNTNNIQKVVAFKIQGIGFDILSIKEWNRLIFHSTHKQKYRDWKFVK